MNALKCFFLFFFISISCFGQDKLNLSTTILESESETYKELSLSEWKKFKSFEQKLALSQNTKSGKERQLLGYARDSIQILGVKLMATKLLNERQLLDKDIAENGKYYADLLQELRESAIPQIEYLFLEEKMALVNQATMQTELITSQRFNVILLLLCIVLGYFTYRFKKGKVKIPELSKQEITVRNLILEGKSNKEIANELFISLSTVKTHITNLYAKLNVASRQELLRKSTGTST